MKRTMVAMIAAVIAVACAGNARADAEKVALSAPANLAAEACKIPVWNDMQVVWNGVVDKRQSPEVGQQTQKGKDPIPVMADPSLTETFNKALRELLPACGMKFVDKGKGDALEVTAEIREFYTGVEKTFFTGKSQAKSSIAFVGRRGNHSVSITVGDEMESKKVRSGSIKQLTQTLNDLFAETLKQIPATPEMKDLK